MNEVQESVQSCSITYVWTCQSPKTCVKGTCCLQVTICLEDKRFPKKEIMFLQENYNLWTGAIHPLMRLNLPHFSCIFCWKIPLLQNNCHEDKVFPQVRSSILGETYHMWKDEVQPPSRPSHFSVWHLSLRNSFTSSKQCCVFSFCSDVSFIWKGISHIQPWPVSFNKYYIHRRVLLHSNAFLILLHGFQSNSSLPCEGTFTHTCTKTFFEECNNHRNATPTPSIFPEICYYS